MLAGQRSVFEYAQIVPWPYFYIALILQKFVLNGFFIINTTLPIYISRYVV